MISSYTLVPSGCRMTGGIVDSADDVVEPECGGLPGDVSGDLDGGGG